MGQWIACKQCWNSLACQMVKNILFNISSSSNSTFIIKTTFRILYHKKMKEKLRKENISRIKHVLSYSKIYLLKEDSYGTWDKFYKHNSIPPTGEINSKIDK